MHQSKIKWSSENIQQLAGPPTQDTGPQDTHSIATQTQYFTKSEWTTNVWWYTAIALLSVTVLALISTIVALIVVGTTAFTSRDISNRLDCSSRSQMWGDSSHGSVQTQLISLSEQFQSLQLQLSNYNQVLQTQLTSHAQQIQELQSGHSAKHKDIKSQLMSQATQIQELGKEVQTLLSQHSSSHQEIEALKSQQTDNHQETQALQVQVQQLSESAYAIK